MLALPRLNCLQLPPTQNLFPYGVVTASSKKVGSAA
jgi:hypothetical protein